MNTKSKWIETITSRKLWAAVANFVTMLLIALGKTTSQAEQIAALIIAGATVIAYIVAQGLVDSATLNAQAVEFKATAEQSTKSIGYGSCGVKK